MFNFQCPEAVKRYYYYIIIQIERVRVRVRVYLNFSADYL